MNDHPDSAELMRAFVERSSHEAFRTLVDRYLPVVYGAAIRRTGNAALAEDVTQLVFADFAKRLPTLHADNRIGAWLHGAATMKARDVMKSEIRRRHREQIAATLQELERLPATDAWQDVSPVIDEAINAMRRRDREAIILRFHEDKSLKEMGAVLGISANAAQKRINRALQKLRAALEHRGITTGAVLLGSLLADGVKAATIPAGLGARISITATAAVPSTGISAWWYRQGIVSGYLVAGAALTLVCGLIPLYGQWAKPRTVVSTNTPPPTVEAAPQPTATKIHQALTVDEIVDELGRILDRPLTSLNRTRCKILVEMIPDADIGRAMEAIDVRWTKNAMRRASELRLQTGIARKWAAQDPPRALNWVMRPIQDYPSSIVRRELLGGLLKIWANQNWDAAWNWTLAGIADGSLLEDAHRDVNLPEAVISGIGDHLVQRAGFRAAVDLAVRIQSGRALNEIADEAKTPEDFSCYMTAAQNLRSAGDRARATSGILTSFRKQDWATANEWVQNRPSGWERAYMGWELGFPEQAPEQSSLPLDRFAEHADRLKSAYIPRAGSKLANKAHFRILSHWMKQDPQAAVNWILANENFPIEDYGVNGIWPQLDPRRTSIADLPTWKNQAARLVRQLQETNREAYEKSLASALSERESLTSHIRAFIQEQGLELEPEDSVPE